MPLAGHSILMSLTAAILHLKAMSIYTGILQFMKNKVLIPLFILGGLAAFFSFRYISHDTADEDTPASAERKALVLSTVMKALNEGHYAPRELDDSFSY